MSRQVIFKFKLITRLLLLLILFSEFFFIIIFAEGDTGGKRNAAAIQKISLKIKRLLDI